MPFLNVNRAELYYEDQGAGPEAIVFAHSLLFNCRMFDDQVNALKGQYRCVKFDFRGQGRSEVTRDGYDMDTLARDAMSTIERLDCAPCHFLGFSMGGFVGLRLAIHRPELLRSLVLVDTSADPEPKENLRQYKLMNLVTRWIGPRAVANQIMPIMFSQGFLADAGRSDLRSRWRNNLVDNHRIGITRAVTGVINRQGVYELLARISVGTLILIGEEDNATPAEKSKRMHKRIPNSRLVTIPNAGHMSPVEEPKAVTNAVKEILVNLN